MPLGRVHFSQSATLTSSKINLTACGGSMHRVRYVSRNPSQLVSRFASTASIRRDDLLVSPFPERRLRPSRLALHIVSVEVRITPFQTDTPPSGDHYLI